MDRSTEDKLCDLAQNIQNFLKLHPEEQRWLFPLLGKAERRAIAILEEIQGHELSYQEIAKLTDSHENTVKSTLYALERGGINLYKSASGKWQTPKGGRNRCLKRLD